MVKFSNISLSAKFDLQHTIPFEFALAATRSATDGLLSITEQRQGLHAEQGKHALRLALEVPR